MSIQGGGLGRWGIVLGLSAFMVGGALVAWDGPGRVARAAQKAPKKAATKKADEPTPKDEAGSKPAPAGGSLSFRRDIAPILVNNCVGCHSGNGAGLRNGKLDMSTFGKLMAGGKRGQDIVAGDPDSSTLVRMIKGEETPRMPPRNAQRGFADEAAAKIESWIKQGARLDAGIAASDPISKYAATLEDLRGAELAKLSPEERDKIAEQAGRERWKKATKAEPEVATSKTGHFLLLSNLPKERATRLLQAMEKQYDAANKLFSTSRTPVLGPTEKIGLYVFKESAPFVEFVRAVENQDVEPGEQARAKLGVESPYLVAVDPAAGGEEAAAAPARKGVRKKKAEESIGGPERTLAGLLSEQLTVATANKAGKPPRWISLGLGAFAASQVEPGSPYYRGLRRATTESIQIGWQAKAQEALGGEGKAESSRAIGFSLFEWMAASYPAPVLANFVRVMLEGQGKLDAAIGECLNLNRQEFLDGSGLWLSERYGRH